MSLTLNDLRYFLETVQTGNISRAAERLGLSQPSLSIALKKLEHELEAPLLVRSKVGVTLTKAGHEFYNKCEELYQHWQKVARGVHLSLEEPAGHYIIGCHPSVAINTLPLFVPKLLERWKGLRLDFVHDLSRVITEQVINSQIDFGIVVNPVKHPDLVITRLLKDRVMVLCKADETPPNILFVDTNLQQSQKILAKLKSKGIQFERTISSSSLEVITQLVAAGAGYGVLPKRVSMSAHCPMTAVHPEAYVDDQICLVSRADTQNSKAHKAMRSLIKESFVEG